MGNHCTQTGGPDAGHGEIDLGITQAERFEKKCQELERENKELQTLTQELMEAREHPHSEADWTLEVDRAQEAAREAYEEASRLRHRVMELEELGQDHEQKLQEKMTELETQEQRLLEKMSREEEAASPNPPANREIVALQAERRALVVEKAELEQTLAERHEQLNHTEFLAQRLQEEKLEAESRLATLQKEENDASKFTGYTGASQSELERLRSENAALGAQCRGLAELAENACKRAEEARLRFEQAEIAARRRKAECDGFFESTEGPFEAGTFGGSGTVLPHARAPTLPEGPTGICVSTPGTPAQRPDFALNASLRPDGVLTPTVHLPQEQGTAVFGRPSSTTFPRSMSSGHSADAAFSNSPGVQAPSGCVEPVPRGFAEPVSQQAVAAVVGATSCPSAAPIRVHSPLNTLASPNLGSPTLQPSSPSMRTVSPRQSMAALNTQQHRGIGQPTSPVVHLQAEAASSQATFAAPPQSTMRTVRSAGVSVQPAGSMPMQVLTPNAPCGLARDGASHVGVLR
mmetsp:Transcript_115360/g.229985  ORF Transcript_115360/g.229985 Transcript_115360/m.229985 type:complete len:520 (-) Transcript_115360:16-1575(-)